MPVTTCKADNVEEAQCIAQQAGRVLESGGLVVFPTETVYGVAASAGSIEGIAALRAFKQRPSAPFTVHLPDPCAAERYVDMAIPMLRRLLGKVMPGPVTVVVDVSDEVVEAKLKVLGLHEQAGPHVYHQNTVGLRCPDHPLGRRILAAVGAPVLATSANCKGQRPPVDAVEAASAAGDAVQLVVDGGRCHFAKASTVVHVGGGQGPMEVTVARSGVYDERSIRKLMRWTMLFVCSGNTCRSPMAEGLAKGLLAKYRGLSPQNLEAAGVRIISAGIFGLAGAPATPEAVAALKKRGIDISDHRSRRLVPALIHEADVIYCMTESHRNAVLDTVPTVAEHTHLLDLSGDIEDPIGSGTTGYQRTAELIHRRLENQLKEQIS